MIVSFYVITQKQFFNLPMDYYWIQSGTKNNNIMPGIIHDSDSNDNRSEKNPFYSEYSAHYYLWKNDRSDIIGICHYRRFFDNGSLRIRPLTACKAIKKLNDNDIILPYHEKLGSSVEEHYERCHNRRDWAVLLFTLKEYDVDFYSFFLSFTKNRDEQSMRNIFVAKKTAVDMYWKWIFPLFDLLEKHIDFSNRSPYQMRVLGYFAERILEPWFIFNGFKVGYSYTYNTDLKHLFLRRLLFYVKRIKKAF